LRIHVTIASGSAPWNLTIEAFQRHLAAYRPDARSEVLSQAIGGEHLSFYLGSDAGQHDGAYFPGQQLILWDGPVDYWAGLIVWFLGLLPPGAATECFLEAVAIPQELPRTATAADVTGILTDLDARY
jgi:hypothetical protein